MCESECVSRRACPVSVSRDVSYLSKIGSNFRSDLLLVNRTSLHSAVSVSQCTWEEQEVM